MIMTMEKIWITAAALADVTNPIPLCRITDSSKAEEAIFRNPSRSSPYGKWDFFKNIFS